MRRSARRAGAVDVSIVPDVVPEVLGYTWWHMGLSTLYLIHIQVSWCGEETLLSWHLTNRVKSHPHKLYDGRRWRFIQMHCAMSAGRRSVGVGRKEVTSCNATVSPETLLIWYRCSSSNGPSIRPSGSLLKRLHSFRVARTRLSFVQKIKRRARERKKSSIMFPGCFSFVSILA